MYESIKMILPVLAASVLLVIGLLAIAEGIRERTVYPTVLGSTIAGSSTYALIMWLVWVNGGAV